MQCMCFSADTSQSVAAHLPASPVQRSLLPSSGFRVLFICVRRGMATIRVEANITTSGSTRTCVLRFAFAKECGEDGK